MRSLAVLVLALCILGITASFQTHERTFELFNHNSRARAVDACPTYSCVGGNGTACGLVDTTKYAICTQKDGYCSFDQGLSKPGTCAATGNKKIGEACTSSIDCDQSGYGLACIGTANNKVCNSNFEPGTPCSNNNNCAYYSPTDGAFTASCDAKRCKGDAVGATCSPGNDMCMPPLTCYAATSKCIAPQSVGANCTADKDCVQTAYCSMGACTARIALGQPCTDIGDVDGSSCAGFAICSPTVNSTAGTCVTGFSVADGQNCTSNVECQEGSYCNPRVNPAKCTKALAFSASSKTACTEQTDCPAGQACACDGQGSNKCFAIYGNYKGYASQYKKLSDCANGCLRTDIDCLTKCKGAYCTVNQNVAGDDWKYASQAGYPACFKDEIVGKYGIRGYFLCSAGSAVAGSVFVVVAALIALLF